MKELLREWKNFLLEGREENFDQNITKLIDGIQRTRFGNETRVFFENVSKGFGIGRFAEVIKNSGATKILTDYKIKDFLGAGGMGIAFSLEEPHENYVMKVQASTYDIGIDNIIRLYKKQEAGKFNPRDLRVLDVFSTSLPIKDSRNMAYTLNIFIIAKVSTSTVAGNKKDGREASTDDYLDDLHETGAATFLSGLAEYRNEDKAKLKEMEESGTPIINYYWQFRDIESKYGIDFLRKLLLIVENSTIDNVARVFYKRSRNMISFLSRDQYVGMCKEYYRQLYLAARDKRRTDFHGGNFGFRPNSDVPIVFDI